MVASEFLSYLDKFHFVDAVGLDDFADRCSYMLSFIILIMCFTIVTLKSYVFEPLSCYAPTTFSGSNMAAYINAFCWVNGTFPANVDTSRLDDIFYWKELDGQKLNYYQWVSLVLALQAILCYLPRLAWDVVTFNRIGTNLNYLMEAAQSASREIGQGRIKKVQFVSNAVDTLLFARRKLSPRKSQGFLTRLFSLFPKKRSGQVLCFYYMLVKLAYFSNSIGQVFLMERFLGLKERYRFFGISILHDILNGRTWQETLIFPRTGFCRVPIKLVGTPIPIITAQCVLPINMLNEKIYIFLWFWFVFVSSLECVSIVLWIHRLAARHRRVDNLVHYLKIANSYDDSLQPTIDHFEMTFLRLDGTFLLYMLRLNAGEIITNEILRALLNKYIHQENIAMTKEAKSEGRADFPHTSSRSCKVLQEAHINDLELKQRLVI